MNNKTLISFLALMVVAVIVYFAISTFHDSTSRNNYYSEKLLTNPVSYKNFKSYRADGKGKPSSVQMIAKNDAQTAFSSGMINNQNHSTRNTETTGVPGINSVKSGTQPAFNNQYSMNTPSSTNEGGTSGMMASGSTLNRVSINNTGKTSTISSQSRTTNSGSRLSSNPQFQPFSESNISGVPDPGGNADDSCEDDIVFIPVPDGLWYMILLSFVYGMIKLFRVKLKAMSLLKRQQIIE
jgi:hypothetical protein